MKRLYLKQKHSKNETKMICDVLWWICVKIQIVKIHLVVVGTPRLESTGKTVWFRIWLWDGLYLSKDFLCTRIICNRYYYNEKNFPSHVVLWLQLANLMRVSRACVKHLHIHNFTIGICNMYLYIYIYIIYIHVYICMCIHNM